eukprot:TRINITY_DN685_c0_g1_i5.p1 TRINITY_DN685_c0_g1~~TRINITY_DN685_c0_g1_i5.p1  ORF type:complete len:176 (-),score=30.57 TRINITY_DN685_c0_g1_i5:26-553(-)
MTSAPVKDQTLQKSKEETLRRTKMDKSAPFFKNTKVLSCSRVVVKNGQAVAVAFPQKKTGYKATGSYGNTGKSAETVSVSHAAHSQGYYMHAGMGSKPLVNYNPNSARNRLPQTSVMMPYKNSSQVIIGNPSAVDKGVYRTTYKCYYTPHALGTAVTNGGILSELTRQAHKQQLK